MHRFTCYLLILGLATCALATMGCSPASKATVATEYVEGVVTLDDKPVAEANVRFLPVTEGQGMAAGGMTDAKGVYKLTATQGSETGEPGGGTLPGEYYVGVVKTTSPDVAGEETGESGENTDEEEEQEQGEDESPDDGGITYVVPQKYNDPKTSGLKVTVKAGKNEGCDLKLTSE